MMRLLLLLAGKRENEVKDEGVKVEHAASSVDSSKANLAEGDGDDAVQVSAPEKKEAPVEV